MNTVNIHEAKTHLSRIIEHVMQGEDYIIAKSGKPMVRVSRVEKTPDAQTSRIGFLEGKCTIPSDFDTIEISNIEHMFFGEI